MSSKQITLRRHPCNLYEWKISIISELNREKVYWAGALSGSYDMGTYQHFAEGVDDDSLRGVLLGHVDSDILKHLFSGKLVLRRMQVESKDKANTTAIVETPIVDVHGLTRAEMIQAIKMIPDGTTLLVKIKEIFFAETQLQLEKRREVFSLLISTLSEESSSIIRTQPEYEKILRERDVLGLWDLIGTTHDPDPTETVIAKLRELSDLMMGDESFPEYYRKFKLLFNTIMILEKTAITEKRAVATMLGQFRGSCLSNIADQLRIARDLPGSPQTLQALHDRLLPAWDLEQTNRMLEATSLHAKREPKQLVESESGVRRNCGCVMCPVHCGVDFTKLGFPKKSSNNNQRQPRSYLMSSTSANRLILDTGSNIHVLKDKKFFRSLVVCDEMLMGVSGKHVKITKKGQTVWGEAYFHPTCPVNLISLGCLCDSGFTVTVSADGVEFVVESKGGDRYEFLRDEDGLFTHFLKDRKDSYLVEHFTAEQRRRAQQVRELHCQLGHPSTEQLCGLLDSQCLTDCKLTSKDVRVSAKINGDCSHCLMGKLPTPPAIASNSTPASAPGELLHGDIAFFLEGRNKKVPYLVVVDDFSDFVHCKRMQSKSAQSVLEKLTAIFNEYLSWGHRVKSFRSDSESVFKGIVSRVNGMGVRMQFAAPGAHERKAEAMIKQLKYRFSTLSSSVKFAVPPKMYPHMLSGIAFNHNLIPTARSSPNIPYTIATGDKFSRSDVRFAFGQGVIVPAPESSVNVSRGVKAVVVAHDDLVKGTVIVYLLDTAQLLVRKVARSYQLEDEDLQKLNKAAASYQLSAEDDIVSSGRQDDSPSPFTMAHINGFDPNNRFSVLGSTNENDEASGTSLQMGAACEDSVLPQQVISVEAACPPDESQLTSSGLAIESSPLEPVVIVDPGVQLRASSMLETSVSSALPDVSLSRRCSGVSNTERARDISDSGESVNTTATVKRMSQREKLTNWRNIRDQQEARMSGSTPTTTSFTRPRSTFLSRKERSVAFGRNHLQAYHMTLRKAETRFPELAKMAANAEMLQLVTSGTLEPVRYAPEGEKVIHSQLLITPKYDIDGELDKVKGRLVASGNEVDRSVYLNSSDTSSPTLKYESFMLLIAATSFHNAQIGTIDFPGAFLNATLDREQYMFLGRDSARALCEVKSEYRSFQRKDGAIMVRLKRALYGLPESGRRWYERLSGFITGSGYSRSAVDPCVFYKSSGQHKIMMGLHVDDLFYVSTSDELVTEFIDLLEGEFGAVKQSARDSKVLSFLGLRIVKDADTGMVEVDQPAYVSELVEDFGDDALPQYPADDSILRSEGELVDQKLFLSKTMKLMYLATKTRSDLLFAVSTLASRSAEPRQSDMENLEKVYKYTRATRDMKVKILCKEMKLSASVDASHSIHPDCKGHSGMVFSIDDCPIFVKSCKQKIVATSSMNAEIVALFDALPFVTWMRDLLIELGYGQNGPTTIQQDNMSALQVYKNGVTRTSKTRHMDLKCAYIKQMVDDNTIMLEYVNTDVILADVYTKPITGGVFKEKFGDGRNVGS